MEEKKLQRFNHWRKDAEKIRAKVPNSVKSALAKKGDKQFQSQDCSADPCNCTGCSGWD